jgi:hypothetical protein
MNPRGLSKWTVRLFVPVCVIAFVAACNFPVRTAGTGLPPTAELAARATDTPSEGAADTPAAPGTAEPAAPSGTPTQTATIVHTSTPGTPGAVEWYVTDYSSKSTAAEKRAPGGDSYTWNLYERPFLAADMKYLPGVDIVRADMMKSGTWFYVTIRLQEAPTADEKAAARYGVEVDADIDGRGDYLIWAAAPGGTAWSTDGVQVWTDKNNDVGGPVPVKSDPPDPGRDGYDDLVFDQGIGADPDAAWARFAPEDPKRVQIAFKAATIGNDVEFLWGVWADAGSRQPGWFDYDDRFTFAEAGSPLNTKAEYPLKALEALDNTCRMAYGFTLLGTEPGACYIETPTVTPTATATATESGVTYVPGATYVPMETPREFVFQVLSAEVTDPTVERDDKGCVNYAYVVGRVTVNRSGTITFSWECAFDSWPFEIFPPKTIALTGAGTHWVGSVGNSLFPPHSHTRRIHVITPNDLYSNEVTITANCI